MAAEPSSIRTLVIAGEVVRFAVGTRREAARLAAVSSDEGRMLRRLLRFLRAGDMFFDVGANIGTVTIPVAATGLAECLSFEPEPRNAARLAENAALNGLDNVMVVEAAMWSAGGTVGLSAGGPVGTGTHTVVERQGEGVTSIPATTIDAFRARGGRPPDVVKVDVEGAELEVLRGAAASLGEGAIRELFCETHPGGLAERGATEKEVGGLLAELGYVQVWAATRGTETHHHFRRREPAAG
jgi:FkbM family methyltransferase